MIAIADSQVLRWIAELNGVGDLNKQVSDIKHEIRHLKKLPNSAANRRQIKELYHRLDELQFVPDYMTLVIDKEKDYWRACEGYSINGVLYHRLLGTNGGIKNNTIVFVSERLHAELERRIENDRDTSKKIVTAKLEAYRALTCSASTPVSFPHGILIVPDVETTFRDDITYITDEFDGEPILEERFNQEITIDASDGCGVMLPSLAERWSGELGLDYTVSGLNTRYSYEKGVLFTFDFIEFADEVADSNYMVKDAWGDDVDIRSVELIFTTSMVKLWDSYESCDDYLSKSKANGYEICVTKTCPESLESERATNYQFLNPLILDDSDIEELIAPTMQEFKDVLGGDWRKTVIFMKGSGLNERNVPKLEDDCMKALMIDHSLINDPFVHNTIYQTLKYRIDDAKVGVLNVHGNYSIVSGDPYALCQSVFRLEVTGLLKAGEIYNQYWLDAGANELACFRAPMTTMSNIRKVKVSDDDAVQHWFQYMKTCTIFNAWDTCMSALNGMDFDGDLCFLTDNKTILGGHRELPALMCAQRKASKCIPTTEDFIRSNIQSFGNEIGQTTNWITSMYDIRAKYTLDSDEHNCLTFRIQSGQLYQQNAIDKAKGIVCKPMPRSWHDGHGVKDIEDDDVRILYQSIVAEKKPYFMQYIYPQLRKECRTYAQKASKDCIRQFGLTIEELTSRPYSELTDAHKQFLHYYERFIPVTNNDCVTNRICRRFEEEFDSALTRFKPVQQFDYTILKSDVTYTNREFYAVKKLYEEYNNRMKSYAVYASNEKIDKADVTVATKLFTDEFKSECAIACPNEKALANIVLDLCYNRSQTKRFAWAICGDVIIDNLLEKNGDTISYPCISDDGEFTYGGNRYTVIKTTTEVIA